MIDLKSILENPELVAENNRKRGVHVDMGEVTALLEKRSALLTEVENLRAEANAIAGKIPKVEDDQRAALVAKGKELKEETKAKEAELDAVLEDVNGFVRQFPNILREDVPEGEDENANELLRQEGEPTVFDFEPKDHLELGAALGMIDMERAAKVSGSRFAYLTGDAVLFEFALVQYALSLLVPEGFVPVLPPHIVSKEAMGAMGYLDHGGEEEIYHLKNDDAVLIGTSEQAIGPMLMDEVLDGDQLPKRYLGISPCYRREAGSYGKDTKGILRLHQFDKIEMFSFTTPEQSDDEHEFLLAQQERLMKGLGLPYRVMKLSSGDTGAPSARTYDIETWMPSQNTYRETHSTSNTTDYQTRRLNTRYKSKDGKGLAHALNGTAFAVGRILIAVMENYQEADGRIRIPDVLRPYMGKDHIG